MMDNNPEECSVCFNDYDDNQLRPRTLPCYHTFCSQCIDNAIKNGQLTCPRCHARHAAKAATQFLISYSMEALVRKLKDIQRTQEKTEPAKKKLRSLVQEQKIIISSLTTNCKEVQETIREAMEMMTTETGATADPVPLEDSASSIMNKDQDITGEILNKQLTVEDLRGMREPVKRLVEAGRVFAVQEDQDGSRSARITLQDGQLYLHPFLRQPTPANAHTLQESEVVGVLEPSCTLAFLDLGWAGSTRGRVTIRLTPDTPLARQFRLLCTGQRGHTYRNTKLFKGIVMEEGEPGEFVMGGDYESNDGERAAPLLPDLKGRYRKSGWAGAVWCCEKIRGCKSAHFAITIRDHKGGEVWSSVFGEVVLGLDVVREAANHFGITEVTVVDCGVVLPL